jgi:hypothetical protein
MRRYLITVNSFGYLNRQKVWGLSFTDTILCEQAKGMSPTQGKEQTHQTPESTPITGISIPRNKYSNDVHEKNANGKPNEILDLLHDRYPLLDILRSWRDTAKDPPQ